MGTLSSLGVSGNLTVDTDTLFVDAANNRVGVGTASPLTRMHINDGTNRNILISTDATQFGSSGMAIGSFTDGAAGYAPLVLIGSTVQVAAGGSIRTTIDTSGNVGIGTASPTSAVSGTARILELVGASGGIGTFKVTDSSATVRSELWSSATGVAGLSVTTNHPLVFSTNNTERARLDASGNLGLGVTPSAASATTLQLPNGVTVSNAGTAASFAHNAVFNSGWKYVSTGAATLYQKYLGAHTWFTAASGTAGNAISFTQALTLHASGGLSLGSTSDPAAGYISASTGVKSPRVQTSTASSFGSVLTETSMLVYADATYGAAIAGAGTTSDVTLLGRNGNVALTVNDTSGIRLGFYGTSPQGKPTVTGSRGANAALASLLTALANIGLLVDSST
jgi:hypothetical protein